MKSLLIFLTFLLVTALSYGQSYTNYEKKCYSLTVEFLKNLGVANSEINNIKSINQLGELMILTLFQKKADRINVSRELYLYERKMKDAEKFKTDVDFKKEKKEKDLEEVKRKSEKLEQDKKTENDRFILKKKEVEEEALRIERQKIDSFKNSDYVKIKEKIKEEFYQWSQKSEFEKTEDYYERIKKMGQSKIDSIGYIVFIERILKIESQSEIQAYQINYDADKEIFKLSFKSGRLLWDENIKIPIGEAEAFKKSYNDTKIVIDKYNWSFVNNYLSPKKMRFVVNNKSFEFNIPNENFKKLFYSQSDLNFQEPEFNTLSFDFEKYYQSRDSKNDYVNIEKIIKNSNEMIVEKVEVEASFKGGQRAWTNYLENNLNLNLIKDNGAPLGSYTVVIRFIVYQDGSIGKLVPETNIGYGIEKEVVRILKESPPWIPAQQHGGAVSAYRRQPVGFSIE